jgi:glycosyltransferase involved in cell wall biosynthesis
MLTGMPLVSFVIPSYNFGRYVRETIEGALRQEGGYDLEVVVVDDASTDESVAVIRSITDPRVRLYCHERNQGHIVTINEGFEYARGRYIARIDSDDRHRACFLRETLPVFERHPKVGMVYGIAALMDQAGQVANEPTPQPGGDRMGDQFVELLLKNFVTAPTVIASREAWQKALPIPNGLGFSDWYLSLQIAKRYPLYFRNCVLADYRVHPEGMHVKMTPDYSEERTIHRLLGEIFQAADGDPRLHRMRGRIYGAQYLQLAEKYFGFQMNRDARRCYLQALRHQPSLVFRRGVPRRLLASLTSRRAYDWLKQKVLGKPLPLICPNSSEASEPRAPAVS